MKKIQKNMIALFLSATMCTAITAEDATNERYASPYIEAGLPADTMRPILLDADLAAHAKKNKQLWFNDILRLGFYMRPRGEVRENLNFNANDAQRINRISQTSVFWMLLNPAKDFDLKLTFQDGRVWGGEAGTKTGNAYVYDDRGVFFSNGDNGNTRGELAVREAYMQFKNLGVAGFSVLMGRQILSYGDGRMLGSANWNANGLSFDGIVFKYDQKYISSHLITVKATSAQGSPNGVISETAALGDSYLGGLYNTLKFDLVWIDLYALGLFRQIKADSDGSVAAAAVANGKTYNSPVQSNLYTFGARVTNRTEGNYLPKSQNWDYTLEAAMQAGNAPDVFYTDGSGALAATSRTYAGKFFFAQTGYKVLDDLRLGAHVYYSPGTEDRSSGELTTFQTLPGPRFGGFPYLNVYNGISENLGMKNILSPAVTVTYENKIWGTFILSFFNHDKATKQDAWYGISGASNTGGAATVAGVSSEDFSNKGNVNLGRNIYREIDFIWMKSFSNHVSAWIGVGYLRAGDAVANARGANLNADAWMAFLQITGNL